MKKLILFSLIVCLFASCKKDNKEDSPPRSALLTTGTWKITAFLTDDDGNGSFEYDLYAVLPACWKDNYFTFKVGGVLEMNEGATKCDPLDSQTENSTWALLENDSKLSLDGDPFVIETLTNTTLRIRDVDPIDGTQITMTRQ
ncbi:MAG TPA: lipocalin family protein [Chitinophagaceae bacterium]|nr:lipocalin family protein [Chitinophagaceae bacterium]